MWCHLMHVLALHELVEKCKTCFISHSRLDLSCVLYVQIGVLLTHIFVLSLCGPFDVKITKCIEITL